MTLIGLVMVGLVPMAPANAATTISVSRGTVIGGESITVSGTLGQRKARPVVLQRKSGTTWVKVLARKSTAAGRFTFTYKPPTKSGSKTVIRVIAPKVRISGKSYAQITTGSRTVLTAAQTATVTAPAVVAQDALFTITGSFTPARAGRAVGLQQLDDGIWVGVQTTKPQDSTGRASFSMSLSEQGTVQFRVITLASGGAPAVASAAMFVSVMPTPTGLSATAGNASVQLSWNGVTANGLAGYAVYQRTDPSDFAPWAKVAQVSAATTTYAVTGLTNGVPHYFSVTSLHGSGGESAFAAKVSATPVAPPDTEAPLAPTGVVAAPGNGNVQVSWNAVVAGDLAGYNVYQWNAGTQTWTKLTDSPISATTRAVPGLLNGTEYLFAVTSVDTATPTPNESAKVTASATPSPGADTTAPPPPSGVIASAGNGTAHVTWGAVAAGDLQGYKVYQSTNAAEPWGTALTPVAISATSFDVSGLTNGTTYYFAVTSVDTSTNESAQSVPASTTPTAPPTGWTAVSSGLQHTCALGSNGTLWCWGLNRHGQLGNSTGTETGNAFPTPTRAGSATNWTSVSAGDDFTCGIQSPGTLWCWGRNAYGQLGSSGHSGTELPTATPTQVGVATNWTSVSAGGNSACGVQSNGMLWCWGLNLDGQLGRVANANTTAPNFDVVQVGALTTWSSVSSGTDHTCARRTDSTVWCWGSNRIGQLGNISATLGTFTPTTTPTQVGTAATWTTVSAGEYHTCGIQTGGAAQCWGSNSYGELGKAANENPNGTPSSAGTGWTSISAGGDHTCGTKIGALLVTDGVYCFGRNQYAQLGKTDNATPNASAARVTASTSAWTIADSGGASTCARTTANTVFCWGLNEFGQLGDPNTVGTSPHPTPFDVLVPAG